MGKILVTIFFFVGLSFIALGEPMNGPLPEEQRNIIHDLAQRHTELKRKVTLTKKGYTATTTTPNKDLADMLKKHVTYMKKRLDSEAMVRRWDPAFAEMVDHYDDLEATIELIKGGVKATIQGKTPEAIKIAQNHAKIVTAFTKNGSDELHEEHPAISVDSTQKQSGKGGGHMGRGGMGQGKGPGHSKD